VLVEPADLAGGAAELDVDAASDVLGGAAQVVLLAGEPGLEHVEVAAQALERRERLVDLDDLGRHAVAQPLAGELPGPEVARAVERERADRVRRARRPPRARVTRFEQDLALAPGVGGELMLVRPAAVAAASAGDSRPAALGGGRAARPTRRRPGRRSRVSAASRARASAAARAA